MLVDEAGVIIARGHNMRVQTGDPTAHAEMVAIKVEEVEMGQEGAGVNFCIWNNVNIIQECGKKTGLAPADPGVHPLSLYHVHGDSPALQNKEVRLFMERL